MLSFDTNVAVHAANTVSPLHARALEFVTSLGESREVVVCELMLTELYLKLRNEKIFQSPLGPGAAVAVCRAYRNNASWKLVDGAPVMDAVWRVASGRGFAIRRIIDARLAFTLIHHGVTEFATTNTRDFQGFGFDRVWNPCV
jgi:toxin-antitoxin system PIN domain toxin